MQTIHIQSYNMVDFLIEVEKNIKNGYTFDFVSIGNFPQLVGGTFIVGMILDQDSEIVHTAQDALKETGEKPVNEGTQEKVQEVVEAPKKAGRPAKAK